MNNVAYDHKKARLLLIGSSISIMLAGFTALAVSTAMPDIVRVLHGVPLYGVAFGIPLVGQLIATSIAGGWTDTKGAKQPLIVGLLLFVTGLLMCGFAPQIYIFIIGRALQGFGGGFLMVPVYALVGLLVRPERRPFFFACFALSWVIPAIFGPVLAGKIVELGHWRWIFFSVTPLVLLAAMFIVPLLFKLPTHNKNIDQDTKYTIKKAIITGVSIGVIMMVGTMPPKLFELKITVISICVAVCIYYVPKIFPKGTFTLKRAIPSVIACRGLSNALFVAIEAFIPLVLQQGRGCKPSESGLVLAVGTLAYAMGSLTQGKITSKYVSRKIPVTGALLSFVGTIMTVSSAFIQIPLEVAVFGWVITGFGIGLIYPAMSVLILDFSPQEEHGKASSSLQLADTIGSSTALATVSTLFTALVYLPPPLPYMPIVILSIIISALVVLSSTHIYEN